MVKTEMGRMVSKPSAKPNSVPDAVTIGNDRGVLPAPTRRAPGALILQGGAMKMHTQLTTTADKDAMLKALRAVHIEVTEDADAGTVVATTRKRGEIFRGLETNTDTWLLRYPRDLFHVAS